MRKLLPYTYFLVLILRCSLIPTGFSGKCTQNHILRQEDMTSQMQIFLFLNVFSFFILFLYFRAGLQFKIKNHIFNNSLHNL